MFEALLIWVGTLAFLVSTGTILASVLMEIRGDVQHLVDVLGGFGGAGLWGVFALGATNVKKVSGGVTVVDSSEPLVFVAVAFAGVSLLVALVGVSSLVNVLERDRNPTR